MSVFDPATPEEHRDNARAYLAGLADGLIRTHWDDLTPAEQAMWTRAKDRAEHADQIARGIDHNPETADAFANLMGGHHGKSIIDAATGRPVLKAVR